MKIINYSVDTMVDNTYVYSIIFGFIFSVVIYCVFSVIVLWPEQVLRIIDDKTPSIHSWVDKLYSPYNSPRVSAFGFNGYSYKIKQKLFLYFLSNYLFNKKFKLLRYLYFFMFITFMVFSRFYIKSVNLLKCVYVYIYFNVFSSV